MTFTYNILNLIREIHVKTISTLLAGDLALGNRIWNKS
jgi:hypothetical protein